MIRIDLQSIPDPKIWMRDGAPCYFDPVSKRLRPKTPEETVRQKLLVYLQKEINIPAQAILVEEALSHWGVKQRGRIDILVCGYDENNMLIPVLVIECKAPHVYLSDDVYMQAVKYAEGIGAPFTAITNGYDLLMYRWNEETSLDEEVKAFPDYESLCAGFAETSAEMGEPYPRVDFALLNSEQMWRDTVADGIIGEDTPRDIVPFALNLVDCFLDELNPCTGLPDAPFRLIADQGRRYTSFGNAGGGSYDGSYRTLMIDCGGNTKLLGLAVFGTARTENDPHWGNRKGATVLVVSIDDEESHHNSLQLCLDDFTARRGSSFRLWHDGRMTAGQMGRVKNREVLSYIAKNAPGLLGPDGTVELGTLKNDHPFTMDEPQMRAFLARLIQYSLLRDEYRAVKKAEAKKLKQIR